VTLLVAFALTSSSTVASCASATTETVPTKESSATPAGETPGVTLSGVHGRVVDAGGAPVAGATVRLRSFKPQDRDGLVGHSSIPLGETTSGPDGRYGFRAIKHIGVGLGVSVLDRTPGRRARGQTSLPFSHAVEDLTQVELEDTVLRSTREGFANLRAVLGSLEPVVEGR
jgi:hypothetical protein